MTSVLPIACQDPCQILPGNGVPRGRQEAVPIDEIPACSCKVELSPKTRLIRSQVRPSRPAYPSRFPLAMRVRLAVGARVCARDAHPPCTPAKARLLDAADGTRRSCHSARSALGVSSRTTLTPAPEGEAAPRCPTERPPNLLGGLSVRAFSSQLPPVAGPVGQTDDWEQV